MQVFTNYEGFLHSLIDYHTQVARQYTYLQRQLEQVTHIVPQPPLPKADPVIMPKASTQECRALEEQVLSLSTSCDEGRR